VSSDSADSQMLSHLQLARGGQDYSRIAENVPVQSGIYDSRKLQVEMNKNNRESRDSEQHQ
jgi:hypothetical protein